MRKLYYYLRGQWGRRPRSDQIGLAIVIFGILLGIIIKDRREAIKHFFQGPPMPHC